MYESLPDELTCPQDYEIPIVTNADTHIYGLPVVTTNIYLNTNPDYDTTRFREAQQPDIS